MGCQIPKMSRMMTPKKPIGELATLHSRSRPALPASTVPTFRKSARWGTPFVFANTKSKAALGLRVHVGAEDGVYAGLVAALLAEPAEQVGVEVERSRRKDAREIPRSA